MPIEEAARVLRGRPADRPPPAHARRRRPRLRPPRPAGADAVRRRGAARQARDRAPEAVHRPHGLRARRADHRPALRRRPQAARRAAAARRPGQHRDRDRAQPRRDQDRRLGHRPRPRGRHGRRHGRREGTPEQVAASRPATPAGFLREILGVASSCRATSAKKAGRRCPATATAKARSWTPWKKAGAVRRRAWHPPEGRSRPSSTRACLPAELMLELDAVRT